MSTRQDTLFRYLAMLQLIPRSPGYRATTTLQTLLEERGFKVDIRSIQRDLEKMSAHFPLICDRERRPFRWAFDPDFKSSLPAMDTPTALTLVLAQEYLTGLLPQIAVDQLGSQFQNARKYLDGLERNGFAHWTEYVKAIPNGKALIPAPLQPDVWPLVTDGLLNGYAVDVEYLSRTKNSIKTFTLHPMGLVAKHSVTYLLATVNDYEDIRQFALHRIQTIRQSDKAFRPQPDFCVDQYVAQGAFGYPESEGWVRLKARVRSDVAWLLSETPVSEMQTLESTSSDGWMLLTAEVPNDQQTQWWLQGFGSAIDVLEPLNWREAIHRQAREILGLSD
ncbi:helix-turn-helix transcriptional regulator [Marinobacterium litorale]|uniref:helix-turn-helix transcriptional regulator n=1 Tax=Marinobacterium litorale TaxID=404770 RepID=UPI00041AE642|nr:WYL domain-containing protein [Marinobacterium litorale]